MIGKTIEVKACMRCEKNPAGVRGICGACYVTLSRRMKITGETWRRMVEMKFCLATKEDEKCDEDAGPEAVV